MTRQIRKHIVNIRKHKPSKICSNGGVLGWYKHLDKIERGLKYELFNAAKADRRIKQREKQEQERVCLGDSKNPWFGSGVNK